MFSFVQERLNPILYGVRLSIHSFPQSYRSFTYMLWKNFDVFQYQHGILSKLHPFWYSFCVFGLRSVCFQTSLSLVAKQLYKQLISLYLYYYDTFLSTLVIQCTQRPEILHRAFLMFIYVLSDVQNHPASSMFVYVIPYIQSHLESFQE